MVFLLSLRLAARSVRPLRRSLSYAAPTEGAAGSLRVEFDRGYETHKLEEQPAAYTYTTKQELLDYYALMYRMRRMEISADTLYKGKYVKGFCHLYDGQEAICVGMEAACNLTQPEGKKFNDSLVRRPSRTLPTRA